MNRSPHNIQSVITILLHFQKLVAEDKSNFKNKTIHKSIGKLNQATWLETLLYLTKKLNRVANWAASKKSKNMKIYWLTMSTMKIFRKNGWIRSWLLKIKKLQKKGTQID